MLHGDRVRVGTLLCTVYETWDNGECALTHPNGQTYMYTSADVFPPLKGETVVGYLNEGKKFNCVECGSIKAWRLRVFARDFRNHSQTCHDCGRLVVDGPRVQFVPFPQPPLELYPKPKGTT